MSPVVDAVAAIAQHDAAFTNPAGAANTGESVVARFERLVGQVSEQINTADDEVSKLALGQAESLHGVMLALEQAKLSLGLMIEVRNKLLDAYQEMQRMQI